MIPSGIIPGMRTIGYMNETMDRRLYGIYMKWMVYEL